MYVSCLTSKKWSIAVFKGTGAAYSMDGQRRNSNGWGSSDDSTLKNLFYWARLSKHSNGSCLVRGLYSHFEKVATIVGLVVVHFFDQGWWRLDASGFGSRKSLGR